MLILYHRVNVIISIRQKPGAFLWGKMKIKCAYCGMIHAKTFDCGKRTAKKKMRYDKEKFRSTAAWQKKAEEIKERDNYLCQVCIRNLYHTKDRINTHNLSVHHAIPLNKDYELRLRNDNLITSCEQHHQMMEAGTIPLDEVKEIIWQQERKRRGRGSPPRV